MWMESAIVNYDIKNPEMNVSHTMILVKKPMAYDRGVMLNTAIVVSDTNGIMIKLIASIPTNYNRQRIIST
ncbi:MAG: hypothetical protein WCK88_06190 [bacterium]